MLLDTVVAVVTPLGRGGVGIIRLSGSEALEIANKLFVSKNKMTHARMIYGAIFSNVDSVLDYGYGVYFAAPRSFTGEDSVEFHLHSNPFLLKKVLLLCVSKGAVMAAPGEFSKRAFLNGKVNLLEAESILSLIDASNDYTHKVALSFREGKLYKHICDIRKFLINKLEDLEASIDFSDEVEEPKWVKSDKEIAEVLKNLKSILDMQDYGRRFDHSRVVMIVGRPNVGKSSFLNQLAGEDRVIVSDQAGTTRDMVDCDCLLGGVLWKFIDTAGLHKTDNIIENMGMDKVKNDISKVDLLLWVLDSSDVFTDNDYDILNLLRAKDCPIYIIYNKIDCSDIRLILPNDLDVDWPSFSISAKTGLGVDAFKKYIADSVLDDISAMDSRYICNIRQEECIQSSVDILTDLLNQIHLKGDHSVMAYTLKKGVEKLGELTGDEITEEILDGIFSRFCIGK